MPFQDSVSFRVIYDIRTVDFVAWHEAVPYAFIAGVLALMAILGPRHGGSLVRMHASRFRIVAILACLFCSWLAVTLPLSTHSEYRRFQRAFATGAVEVVEGRVRDFVPGGADGHPMESFRIGQRTLRYSTSDITSAYHITAADGGRLREEQLVRVTIVENRIVRLEISDRR